MNRPRTKFMSLGDTKSKNPYKYNSNSIRGPIKSATTQNKPTNGLAPPSSTMNRLNLNKSPTNLKNLNQNKNVSSVRDIIKRNQEEEQKMQANNATSSTQVLSLKIGDVTSDRSKFMIAKFPRIDFKHPISNLENWRDSSGGGVEVY